jgi:hypothetical protein
MTTDNLQHLAPLVHLQILELPEKGPDYFQGMHHLATLVNLRDFRMVRVFPDFFGTLTGNTENQRWQAFQGPNPAASQHLGKLGATAGKQLGYLTRFNSPIRTLSLKGFLLLDDDLRQVGKLTSLERLDLSDSPITGAGLAYLQNLKELRELKLADTLVTDEDLKQMLPFRDSLTELALDRSPVTRAGLAWLDKHMPRVGVHFQPVGPNEVSRDPLVVNVADFDPYPAWNDAVNDLARLGRACQQERTLLLSKEAAVTEILARLAKLPPPPRQSKMEMRTMALLTTLFDQLDGRDHPYLSQLLHGRVRETVPEGFPDCVREPAFAAYHRYFMEQRRPTEFWSYPLLERYALDCVRAAATQQRRLTDEETGHLIATLDFATQCVWVKSKTGDDVPAFWGYSRQDFKARRWNSTLPVPRDPYIYSTGTSKTIGEAAKCLKSICLALGEQENVVPTKGEGARLRQYPGDVLRRIERTGHVQLEEQLRAVKPLPVKGGAAP